MTDVLPVVAIHSRLVDGEPCKVCEHRHERTDRYGYAGADNVIFYIAQCAECGCCASRSEYFGESYDCKHEMTDADGESWPYCVWCKWEPEE